MHTLVHQLITSFEILRNASIAQQQKAYMLGQFEFCGIKTAERRKNFISIAKQYKIFSSSELKEVAYVLWQLPEREYQYCAIELLAQYRKYWSEDTIEQFEYFITSKSWWDTVDHVASNCLASYFKQFSYQIPIITAKWNVSDNIWLQRSSIMFQKSFKQNTNVELLGKYIQHSMSSKEFFIQKAIGWSLREYAKTNPQWVLDFVQEHQEKLPALSKREALKHLK